MDYQKRQDLLMSYLTLERYPVGVKFLFTEEETKEFDGKIKENKLSYCAAAALASKGESIKMIEASHSCLSGAGALGFTGTYRSDELAQEFCESGYFKDVETASQAINTMGFIEKDVVAVGLKPLAEFKKDPDVVLIFGDTYSIMRAVQGYSYVHGMFDNFKSSGLQAVCQDISSSVFDSQEINVSFFCPGTRLLADWERSEAAMGIPWKYFDDVLSGIKDTLTAYERNPNKKRIIKLLENQGYDTSFIKLNTNCDDGDYVFGKLDEKEIARYQ